MPRDRQNDLVNQLRRELDRQTHLQKQFEKAHTADELKDEIGLGEAYRKVTTFRMNTELLLVRHDPTTILEGWPAMMTGPKRLKAGVEAWVDQINLESAPQRKP